MENPNGQAQAPGLTLADIYYVVFRHKWKILVLFGVGLVTAAVYYLQQPHLYSSEAELYIRYVVESRLPSGVGGDSQIKTPDPGGGNIINSEIEIIKSLDLAAQVVDAVGPEKILGKGGAGTNRYVAAALLRSGLNVEVLPRSDILRIVFQHPDREVVQPVLDQLISAYLRKHVEIHSSVGAFDDVLTQQTDALKSELAQTEADLRRAKTNAGLMDVEHAKKAYAEEISKVREMLFDTQAELAARQAAFRERQKLIPAAAPTSTNPPDVAVPAAKMEEYKNLTERLGAFRKREQELLAQFTEENSLVRGIREQMAAAEKLRRNLEAEFPKLTQLPLPSSQPGAPGRDWSDETTQITALQAKLMVLTNQLERLTVASRTVNEIEPAIAELQRKRDLEESKYRHFSTSLEQARFDEALSAGKMSNIRVVQTPSPPYRESRRLFKTLGMIVGAGVFGGIALAFLIEFVFDSTVRRPVEVETRLRLPLFLTVPDTRRNGPLQLPAASPAAPSQEADGEFAGVLGEAQSKRSAPAEGMVLWSPGDKLRAYYDSLRDRLVTFFEMQNLTRKPKLIALTGCAKGAGVTTLATGLAASLSETGDGNVLLVDMTSSQGAAHPFFKGKPGCGLAEALEAEKRDNALVQANLYMVTEADSGDTLHRLLPRRFNTLVPKLKASDYDYIIFDMPPVGQISITPRLAGFMDMVLLVMESEKTDRETVKRAAAMLAESKAHVGAVLNKNHDYVPKRLSQEI